MLHDEEWEQKLYVQLVAIRACGFEPLRYRMSAATFQRLSQASYRVDVLKKFDGVPIDFDDDLGGAVEFDIAAIPAPRKVNLGHSIKVR